MAVKDLCEAFKKGLIPNSFASDNYFRNFAVDPTDLNKGGYLRNILISYD